MFDFHEKRKLRGLVYSKVVIGTLLILTGLLSLSVYERFMVEREMYERRAEREEELRGLEARAGALEEKVDHLEDDRGLEEEIRGRFDVVKEGEQVIIIVDDETVSAADLDEFSEPPGSNQGTEGSLFDKLLFWR